MAQPVVYQTLNMEGIDPTTYYTNLATPGGSVTPEFPAPPFLAGTKAFGSDGSEFIFVQASTSISLGDFVYIDAGITTFPFSAASLTTTNAKLANCVGVASAGIVLKQSVTYIPANAYFWACTHNNLTVNAPSVTLYTTATAGVISSVALSTAVALNGIVCIISLTTSLAVSVVPPVGVLTTTGFALGPYVAMMNPRAVDIFSTASGVGSAFVGW